MTSAEGAGPGPEPKRELSKELGLLSVFSIATGTMIGAGLFVLPGFAVAAVGSAALLAFLLASLVAFATGLSASELATAMPKAGGTYHFLDRALGPTAGSVAGLGTWSLSILKGAFAAVAFALYLRLLWQVPLIPVALLLALLLLIVNVVGVQHTGAFQSVVVILVLVGTGAFAAFGLTRLGFDLPPGGLPGADPSLVVATAGLVLFGYVGIIKATAVSEEVRNPARNLPWGILLSLLVVTVLYLVVVALEVAVPVAELHSVTAVVDVADVLLGDLGAVLLAAVGILALASMANASILAAARYGYAMAHDRHLPVAFGRVSSRFATPHVSILATGVPLLLLVALVDVLVLAELTSVFAILLFFLYNAAVIVMRRSSPDWYAPSFRSPGYPWVQVLGMAGAAVLLVFMGWLERIVALAFVAGGVGWYLLYSRSRTDPRGELREVVRRQRVDRALADAADRVEAERPSALLPMDDPEHARDIFHLASWLLGGRGGFVRAVKVESIPFQTPLHAMETFPLALPEALTAEIARDAVEFDLGAEFVVVYAHDPVQGLLAASRGGEFSLLLLDWDSTFVGDLGRTGLRRLFHHPSMHVALFRDRGLHVRERVLLASVRGPYDELEVALASGAALEGGQVTLLRVLAPDAPAAQEETVEEYHAKLQGILEPATQSRVVRSSDPTGVVAAEARDHDLLVMRVAREPKLRGAVFGRVVDEVARRTSCSLVLTNQAEPHRRRLFRWLLHRSLG